MDSKFLEELDAKINDMTSRVSRAESRLEKCRTDLDALVRTREILASDIAGASGKSGVRGTVASAVREVVSAMQGEFGSKETLEAMRAKWPDRDWDRTTISTTLKRLVDEGILAQTVAASGRAPGQFHFLDRNKLSNIPCVSSDRIE